MSNTLEGEIALVTGAGKRIGRAIALELARQGADVAVHVNRSIEEGEKTCEEIEALGRKAILLQANQGSVSEIERACKGVRDSLGTVTILVNSAATWPHLDVLDYDEETYGIAMDVNLRGPFFWAKYLGAEMMEAMRGSIVSISDVSYDRPLKEALPYCMAKAGIVTMTYGLAKAFAPYVRVNAIGPGPIIFPPDYPDSKKEQDRKLTLRGEEGSPEDIAKAVLFLVNSSNITGVFLPVDGGYRFGI